MLIDPNDIATEDAIATLAEEIARSAPHCAEKAMQIVDLVRSSEVQPDRFAVQDAIESSLFDGEMSDAQLQTATSAVLGTLRK